MNILKTWTDAKLQMKLTGRLLRRLLIKEQTAMMRKFKNFLRKRISQTMHIQFTRT